MFFGKNKNSLKLVKQHPNMLMGATYHIVESAENPRHVKIGSGISQMYLRDDYGEYYLVEGNATRIREHFQPIMVFENVEGTVFKLKRPIGSLFQNVELKETVSLTSDEKIYVGNGVTERYFVEKGTNKIIKFVGNSTQIKNLLEEKVLPKPVAEKVAPQPKPQIQIIEKTIVKEIIPQAGSQGLRGEPGKLVPLGHRDQEESRDFVVQLGQQAKEEKKEILVHKVKKDFKDQKEILGSREIEEKKAKKEKRETKEK